MNRRQILAGGLATLAPAPAFPQAGRTRWSVTTSEGFDALAFLGPLSGRPLYTRHYQAEIAAFAPRWPASARAALDRLQARADAENKLLWPTLANVLSFGPTDTLAAISASLDRLEAGVLPGFQASTHWDGASWALVSAGRADLKAVLAALAEADFPGFRAGCVGPRDRMRPPELLAGLSRYDVIAEQERLIGRRLDPTIGVVLLWFSNPHGVSVGGQRSLSHFDYPLETLVRITAHEMLHPPFPMEGASAKAALAVLEADPLMVRILKEHDPEFGYNSMEGILDEDTVEAIDQIVSDRLGVARDPARRWRTADGGMHVLAAGLYGLLTAEGYDRTGGNIEAWMLAAARGGKLAPASLHPAAARVLGTTPDSLWPAKGG